MQLAAPPVEYDPAAHANTVATDGSGHDDPAGHTVHDAWPPAEYVPGKHSSISDEILDGHAWPAGHGVHSPAPASAKLPSSQSSITPDALQRLPAGHCVQLACRPTEYVPAGHATSCAVSTLGQ